VLVDRIDDRGRGARTVALGDVADALVDRGLEDGQALLRRGLVVESNDLELDPGRVAGAELFADVLKGLEAVLADVGKRPRQRVDPGDLDCFTLLRGDRQGCGELGGCRAGKNLFQQGHRGVSWDE
jgi:hypothetical protein